MLHKTGNTKLGVLSATFSISSRSEQRAKRQNLRCCSSNYTRSCLHSSEVGVLSCRIRSTGNTKFSCTIQTASRSRSKMHAIPVGRHCGGAQTAAGDVGLCSIVVDVVGPCCSAAGGCVVASVSYAGAGQHRWGRRLVHRLLVRPCSLFTNYFLFLGKKKNLHI